jgi:predicted aspartyl protease
MRKSVLIAGGLSVLLAGCGSSTSSAHPAAAPITSKPVADATAVATAPASPSAQASVGPTNPAQSPGPKPATVNLLVVKRNGAAIVVAPLVIHGKTYQFVVDTGATVTVIDQTYATQLGLTKTKAAPIPVTGVTGSGTAYLATVSDWQIGQAKIPTSTITVSTIHLGAGLVGLLGSDVLSTFGKITIDYSAQKAYLG